MLIKIFIKHSHFSDEEESNISIKVLKPPQPKQLFGKDSTRSPLSSRNIDVNSPRNIVQRKQARKLDLAKSSVQQTLNSALMNAVSEKENLDF